LVDTLTNKAAAQRFWSEHPSETHLTGVTTFTASVVASAEETLLRQIATIELHDGVSETPYTALEVVGIPLSDSIKTAMAEYGFDEFHRTTAGFVAVRQVIPTFEC